MIQRSLIHFDTLKCNVPVTNKQNEITKFKVNEVALNKELNQLKTKLENSIC